MASNMETILPSLRENITIDQHSHEYSVYGPNRSLIEWTRNSRLAEGILEQAKINTDVLFRAFGSQEYSDRIKASKEAIKSFWYSYPELGPYPLLDLLSEFQFENFFYPEYRDHVAHQLKVLLLGLYFFDKCEHLQSRIMHEIDGESDEEKKREFIRRWIVCAVFHDIGYVIENEKGNKTSDGAWRKTCNTLNESFKAPLSELSDILSKGLSHEVEWHIARHKGLPLMTLEHPADIWQMNNEDDILKKLDDFGLRSGLAASGSPLRNYYDYAFAHKPVKQNRGKFWDHGIASALLLMRTWFHYRKFLEEFCKIEHDNLDKSLMQYLNSLKSKVQDCEKSIIAAAGTIALHNIDPSLWDHGDAFSTNSLTLKSFRIILNGDDVQNPRGPTPMAFLLRLADILQDWGRSKFRASGPNEKRNLLDQDMAIQVDKGKIKLFFPDDYTEFKNPADNPGSKYKKALQELKSCLEEKAVSNLVSWGKPTWVTIPKRQHRRRISPLKKMSFINNVNLIELAEDMRERLKDPDGSIVNKYHYLDAHGAFAWSEVEKHLEIKESAWVLLSKRIKYILKATKEVSEGKSLDIVSLGTGTGHDDVTILKGLRSAKDYQSRSLFTVDISLDLLGMGYENINRNITRNNDPAKLHPICTDIEALPKFKKYFDEKSCNDNRLFHLLGLTLGNNKEMQFLHAISKSMFKGDFLLLGVDFSADDKTDGGQLDITYQSYKDADAEVDMFLSSPLKTAMEFKQTEEQPRGFVEAEGIWITKNHKEYNYLLQNYKIATHKEEGISDIEGTVSFTRYYTNRDAVIDLDPDPDGSKLCDYSHKYNSDAFKEWLVSNKNRLKLESVVDVRKWGQDGQYLVLLRRF